MRRTAHLFFVTLLSAVFLACSGKSDGTPNDSPDGGPQNDNPGHDGNTPGQRFELTSTDYAVPAAGTHLSGIFETANTRFEEVGDEYWTLFDVDGDKYPDLVVTTVIRQVLGTGGPDDTFDEVYDYQSTTPDWHVYKGGPNGFDANFIKWPIPQGGRTARGFNRISLQGGADRISSSAGQPNKQGDMAWIVRDMDGDGRPDLVVTGVAEELVQVGYVFKVPGGTDAPHWNVYKNTGNGFAAQPTEWPVPTMPVWDDFSGLSLESSAVIADYKKQLWYVTDMNGDKRPDLVAYSVVEKMGSDNAYHAHPEGQPSGPHWNVFLNDGKSFSPTSTPWTLPRQRGIGDDGLKGTYSCDTQHGAEGDNCWGLFDITGDGKPDLVVTAVQISYDMKSFGYPSTSHWEVYPNTGSTFGDMSQWVLPQGGSNSGGYYAWEQGYGTVPGATVWETKDIAGDGRLDLVVTGEYTAGVTPDTYNLGRVGDSPHWKVYHNNGTNFDPQPKDWALPVGGLRDRGYVWTYDGFGSSKKIDDDDWTLLDLNADGRPDLVRLSTVIQDPRDPNGPGVIPQVKGFGGAPHWLVYHNTP